MQYNPNFGSMIADISLNARHIQNVDPDFDSTRKTTHFPIFRFFQGPLKKYCIMPGPPFKKLSLRFFWRNRCERIPGGELGLFPPGIFSALQNEKIIKMPIDAELAYYSEIHYFWRAISCFVKFW